MPMEQLGEIIHMISLAEWVEGPTRCGRDLSRLMGVRRSL